MSGRTAICVRKGKVNSENIYDYHFMKVFSSSIWRHKPSYTHILTYNSLPQNSLNWTNEYALSSNDFHEGNTTYTGTIYYILFADDHDYVKNATTNNYHEGNYHYYQYKYTCKYCGDTYLEWECVPCAGVHPNGVSGTE